MMQAAANPEAHTVELLRCSYVCSCVECKRAFCSEGVFKPCVLLCAWNLVSPTAASG